MKTKKLLTILLLLATSCFIHAQNNRGTNSDTTVIVSIEAQRTYVYVNNNIEKTFICSTGLLDNDNNTPLGDYIINESGVKRGTWFFSKTYSEGAKYWVGFIGGVYLFHSLPMDENQNIIEAEAKKLGQPSSHGCIRLSLDDAYWFYKNIPDNANLHIINHFDCKQNLLDCKNYKNQPIPKTDMFVYLTANGSNYKQKYTLSCEIALIRTVAALCGVYNISEDNILSTIPKDGIDPEKYFVCDDVTVGRRNKDGSIHWNNYGAHPPVVIKEINKILYSNNKSNNFTVKEECLNDKALSKLIDSNKNFRGAIIWLVGHPETWGNNPQVNERGMVLGEHVCFVLPVKSSDGDFLVYNPESGKVKELKETGAYRDLFNYRTVTIYSR